MSSQANLLPCALLYLLRNCCSGQEGVINIRCYTVVGSRQTGPNMASNRNQ